MALDQRPDFPVRRALWAGVGLALTVSVVIGAVLLMLRYWDLPASGPNAATHAPLRIAGPALQADPQSEHARYLAEQQRWLTTSAWVDARAGIVRIPLDEAMALLAQGQTSPRAANTDATRGPEARH